MNLPLKTKTGIPTAHLMILSPTRSINIFKTERIRYLTPDPIEETSIETTAMIKAISKMMADYKAVLKPLFGTTYKHELLNNLFFHPYTKIEFVCHDMGVQRKTGAKYLDMIVAAGLLNKIKIGRENYYINERLFELFLNYSESVNTEDVDIIRTE